MVPAKKHVEVVVEDAWRDVELDMFTGVASELHPLTAEEGELIQQEAIRAKTNMLALLRVKLDYLFRLPHILIGLAVVLEERARAIGARAIELFERDPRPPPIHHRQTWKLLKPGTTFREWLIKFANGVPCVMRMFFQCSCLPY